MNAISTVILDLLATSSYSDGCILISQNFEFHYVSVHRRNLKVASSSGVDPAAELC